MKNLFPGFYSLSNDDFIALWKNGVFVLDTNFLLNLYRYPTEARNELVKIFHRLSGRLFLPFQAALEYQRNRLKVIAEQKKRFYQLRKVLNDYMANLNNDLESLQLKKRHSSIEPDELIDGFGKLLDSFLEKLNELEQEQQNVTDYDPIRDEIEKIIGKNIGDPPKDQPYLDGLFNEGEKRYELRIPPGYLDSDKEKRQDGEDFQYGGLIYKRKFGDFILWKQIIEYTKSNNIKYIIFLTDDNKEDWWWVIDSQGKKTIGPRPELVEEIKRESGLSCFHMYNSEQFLKYSRDHLQAEVSQESINQVRDISQMSRSKIHHILHMARMAENSVFDWLIDRHPNSTVKINRRGFPDFIVSDSKNKMKLGYEVKFSRHPRNVFMMQRDSLYRAYYEVNEKKYDQIVIVFVTDNKEHMNQTVEMINRGADSIPEGVKIVVGLLIQNEDETDGFFEPIQEIGENL